MRALGVRPRVCALPSAGWALRAGRMDKAEERKIDAKADKVLKH